MGALAGRSAPAKQDVHPNKMPQDCRNFGHWKPLKGGLRPQTVLPLVDDRRRLYIESTANPSPATPFNRLALTSLSHFNSSPTLHSVNNSFQFSKGPNKIYESMHSLTPWSYLYGWYLEFALSRSQEHRANLHLSIIERVSWQLSMSQDLGRLFHSTLLTSSRK